MPCRRGAGAERRHRARPDGEGRGVVLRQRRLCPAAVQARRGRAGRGHHRRFDRHHPLRVPHRHSHGPLGRGRAGLCLLRAPRSRRQRDPIVAGAPRAHQHHGGGRTHLHRFPARQLDRSTAQPADRGGARVGRARPRRGEGAAAAARRGDREEAPADPRARAAATDFRALRVRDARRRRRLLGAQRRQAVAAVRRPSDLRSRRRQDRSTSEHRLDQPEGRGRRDAGRDRPDRRRRRALLPRGEELHRRCRLPVRQTKGLAARRSFARRREAGKGGRPFRGGQADLGGDRQTDEGGGEARGCRARGQGSREVAAAVSGARQGSAASGSCEARRCRSKAG